MFLVLSMFPIGLRLDSLPLSDNLSLAAAIFIFHRKREKIETEKCRIAKFFSYSSFPSSTACVLQFKDFCVQRFKDFLFNLFDRPLIT